MPCRTLTRDDVAVHLDSTPDDIPIVGNACVSGDEDFDHRIENEILHRLEQGDIWAWASVAVTVSWNGQEATEYLGCCCYDDEEEFRQAGGYFEDMVATALDSLNDDLKTLYDRLST